MKFAMIGLGRMGSSMVRRLVRDGYEVIAFDTDVGITTALANELDNVTDVSSVDELINALVAPRVIWLVVPHLYVDNGIEALRSAGMGSGDLLVDGGNSDFILSIQRAVDLVESGIN